MQEGEPYHAGTAGAAGDRLPGARTTRRCTAGCASAGFIAIGRANTPEWGSTITTEPLAHGPSRNPWDLDHSTGGSSGGSAAAVAAEIVPVGHASDGGGSIRIPASECGLVGLKPSRVGCPTRPLTGEGWAGWATNGAVTRTVRDAAAVLDVLAGYELGDPYVAPPLPRPAARRGRRRSGSAAHRLPPLGRVVQVDPECVAAVAGAADLLASLGHRRVATAPACCRRRHVRPVRQRHRRHTPADTRELEGILGRPVTADDLEPDNLFYGQLGRGSRRARLPGDARRPVPLDAASCCRGGSRSTAAGVSTCSSPRCSPGRRRRIGELVGKQGVPGCPRAAAVHRAVQRLRPTGRQPAPALDARRSARRCPTRRRLRSRGPAGARRRPAGAGPTVAVATATRQRLMEASLDRSAYCDPAVFDDEQRLAMATSWVCIGRNDSIGAEPGSYRLTSVAGERVLIVRDNGGALGAFANRCMHRGTELVDSTAGAPNACFQSVIRCPYHFWAYGFDGSLRASPWVDDIDPAEFSLHRYDLAEWGGFVFVRLVTGGPSLLDDLGPIATRVDRFPLHELVVGGSITYEVAANWKVIAENYNECYHCGPVHPELCELVPSFRVRGGATLDWEQGIPHRPGADTYTVSGTSSRVVPGAQRSRTGEPLRGTDLPEPDDVAVARSRRHVHPPTTSARSHHDRVPAVVPSRRGCQGRVRCVRRDRLLAHGQPAGLGDLPKHVQRGMTSRSFDHGWYAPMEDPSLDIRRWWSGKMRT